jgi:hypothetical protein
MLPVREIMTHHWPLKKFRDAYEAVAAGGVVKGWIEI